VRFFRAKELVTTLIEARDERTFLRLKSQLTKLDLLVLDELGYVPASKVGAELLIDVISTAYERTSMIVTTNLPFVPGPRSSGPNGSLGLPSTGSPTAARSSRPEARATGSTMPRPGHAEPSRPRLWTRLPSSF
jgi:hypothetical protein